MFPSRRRQNPSAAAAALPATKHDRDHHGRRSDPSDAWHGAVLRAEEDRRGRRLREARPRADQGERRPHRADPPGDAPTQGVRADHARREVPVQGHRHAHPRPRRREDEPDLRHQAVHRQGARRLLPEVRRRGHQEGGQGPLRPLRPDPPRRRPPPLRAQEVRRPRRPRQVPEVVPLSCSGGVSSWMRDPGVAVLP